MAAVAAEAVDCCGSCLDLWWVTLASFFRSVVILSMAVEGEGR